MGEVMLRRFRPTWQVYSAGLEAHDLHPVMLQVMAEGGKLPTDLHSKSIQDLISAGHPLESFDRVVTLCGDALNRYPVVPGKVIHEQWSFPDPAKFFGSEREILGHFRRVRDDLSHRMQHWVTLQT
ncbi:MAG: arsenate reductase ArsC [Holophagaceae bacterium]|nr:arsenate reductase ArsC [Holophagaceae bacterium]